MDLDFSREESAFRDEILAEGIWRHHPLRLDILVTLVEAYEAKRFPLDQLRRRLDTPATEQVRRLGLMAGEIAVPDDFDRMGGAEIERLFRGGA